MYNTISIHEVQFIEFTLVYSCTSTYVVASETVVAYYSSLGYFKNIQIYSRSIAARARGSHVNLASKFNGVVWLRIYHHVWSKLRAHGSRIISACAQLRPNTVCLYPRQRYISKHHRKNTIATYATRRERGADVKCNSLPFFSVPPPAF